MFMQTLDQPFKIALETGKFSLPYSEKVFGSYVDYRDVAEVAAIAFCSDKLDYGTFELCSAGMVSRLQVAEIMTSAGGREIQCSEPKFDEWADQSHIPHGFVRDGLRKMYEHYDKHGLVGGNSLMLETILNREPNTLQNYLKTLNAV